MNAGVARQSGSDLNCRNTSHEFRYSLANGLLRSAGCFQFASAGGHIAKDRLRSFSQDRGCLEIAHLTLGQRATDGRCTRRFIAVKAEWFLELVPMNACPPDQNLHFANSRQHS
jgi:hypothetical protein